MARAAAPLLALLALACATPIPYPAVPAWNQPGAASAVAEDERALWAEAARSVEKLEEQDALVEDAQLEGYLDGVLAALLPGGLPAEAPKSRVRVLRTAERNAAALADGTVLVSTSFLAALADEAQLAALLGHEVAHQLARHTVIERRFEKLSASTVRRMELSRALEEEADRIGLERIEHAGYEPRAVIEMLELISQDDAETRGPYPQFESHPFVPERIRALRGLVPRAAPEPGRREAARYEAALADLLLVAAEIELEEGQLERADAAIDRHLRLRPESGRGWYWKAEHERRVAKEGRHAPAARRAYERAVELAPDDPDALRALGFLYRESGEPERARALFGRYLSVAPDAADRKLIERYLGEDPSGSAAGAALP
jgi:predicted Zn-dependent protease